MTLVPTPERLAETYDAVNEPAERAGLAALRRELLAGAAGRTVEIGAGTGLNLGHYPPAVTRLVLAEPEPHMRAQLVAKVARGPDRLERAAGRDGTDRLEVTADRAEALRFPSGSFDTAVCTMVLCTVPDPPRALAEIRRVLRPGGRLLFLEHVRAERRRVAALQHAITPLYVLLAGGCHPGRNTAASIEAAGFRFEWRRREIAPATPRLERELIVGAAA